MLPKPESTPAPFASRDRLPSQARGAASRGGRGSRGPGFLGPIRGNAREAHRPPPGGRLSSFPSSAATCPREVTRRGPGSHRSPLRPEWPLVKEHDLDAPEHTSPDLTWSPTGFFLPRFHPPSASLAVVVSVVLNRCDPLSCGLFLGSPSRPHPCAACPPQAGTSPCA